MPPKSVGNGMTFAQDLVGWEQVRSGVTALAHSVARRLRRHGMKCWGVQVTVRDPQFHDVSRRCRLEVPVCTAPELVRAAMEIIEAHWPPNAPIRAITVTALHLAGEDETAPQLDLFGGGERQERLDRRERLAHAMDGLRSRFGADTIGPASGRTEDGTQTEQQEELP